MDNKLNNLNASEYAFQQNEQRANIQMSKMLLAVAVSLIIVWVMYLCSFMTTHASPFVVSAYFLGASLILGGTWFICGYKCYSKAWSKYVIMISLLIIAAVIMNFDIIFSLLFFALSLVVSCRYYDNRFLGIISVICLVLLFFANYLAAYSRPLFSDTNSIYTWLAGRSGVNNFQTFSDLQKALRANRNGYLENIFVRLYVPEALGLILISIVGAFVSSDGKLILQEQESIFAQKAQTEIDLANNRSLLMLSQIQPHFLFNTLNSIYYLCDEDAMKAKESIDKFATYLRMNVDTLSHSEMVPILKELEHVEIYLSLEKIRFEERLNYIFDVQTSDFMIPPLTIQPIVENAVKHGIMKKKEGGLITVTVKQDDNNYIITVSDDGVGFDVKAVKDDGKVHVGIANIRERLEKMCSAGFDTVSVIGEGTTVTISIPKQIEG